MSRASMRRNGSRRLQRKSGESSKPNGGGSVSMLEAGSGRDDFGARKGTFSISRRTHPSRLDVFGKTEAAGQRGVGEEGDLVDLAAAQGEHHHAPRLRAQVVAEGRLAVGAGRA